MNCLLMLCYYVHALLCPMLYQQGVIKQLGFGIHCAQNTLVFRVHVFKLGHVSHLYTKTDHELHVRVML